MMKHEGDSIRGDIMLHRYVKQFLDYCQIAGFSGRSLRTLTARLNEFNERKTGPLFLSKRKCIGSCLHGLLPKSKFGENYNMQRTAFNKINKLSSHYTMILSRNTTKSLLGNSPFIFHYFLKICQQVTCPLMVDPFVL